MYITSEATAADLDNSRLLSNVPIVIISMWPCAWPFNSYHVGKPNT